MRQAGFGKEHRTFYEKVEHLLVKSPLIFLDRLERLIGSGIEHQNIHRAQGCSYFSDEKRHCGFAAHIAAHQHPFTACLQVFGKSGFGPGYVIDIVDGHPGPGLAQCQGHGFAQTSRAASDQGHAAPQ